MSDLVGNPEDQFSQNEAQLRPSLTFFTGGTLAANSMRHLVVG